MNYTAPHNANPFPEWGDPCRVLDPGVPLMRYGLALPYIYKPSIEGTGPESLRGEASLCGLLGYSRRDYLAGLQQTKRLPIYHPKGCGFGHCKSVAFLSQLLAWVRQNQPVRFFELGINV